MGRPRLTEVEPPARDRVLAILATAGTKGLTATQIHTRIGGYTTKSWLLRLLAQLADEGLVARRDGTTRAYLWTTAGDPR